MKSSIHARAGTLSGFLAILMTFLLAYSARSTPPGISVLLSTNNTLQLTVTNAVPGETYVLEYSRTLDTSDDWQVYSIGQVNQTNFTASMVFPHTYYRILSGTDWDSDGIVNWQDIDPLDSGKGILTVIIESPLNGSTIY